MKALSVQNNTAIISHKYSNNIVNIALKKTLIPRIRASAVILLLLCGLIFTFYGLFNLGVTDTSLTGWRPTHRYLVLFLGLILVVAILGKWCDPFLAGISMAVAVAGMLGVFIPIFAICFLVLSMFLLGCTVSRGSICNTDCILLGAAIYGTLISLLVYFPINFPATWAVIFSIPLVFGWRQLKTIGLDKLKNSPSDFSEYLVKTAIVSVALIHFLAGLMPEIGHDALVMHLFAPAYVFQHAYWSFDATTYAWAVEPMLVDWLYAVGYMFGGETSARLLNVFSIYLLSALVYRTAIWGGANRIGAYWASLLLLSTPLLYLESSSLFIEGFWSAFALGGTLAVLNVLTKSESARSGLFLSGVFLGAAMACKAVTLTMLPVLALVLLLFHKRWYVSELFKPITISLLIFCALGLIPYITAYCITNNPVFPFFNGYFKSPLYPAVNFAPPAIFERGFNWDTLYRITFDSSKYLEAGPGAAGFQWVLLVIPSFVFMGIAKNRQTSLLAMIGLFWLVAVFMQTAYLRYILPSVAVACVLVGVGLTFVVSTAGVWAKRLIVVACALTLALNLLHFDSATYYGSINLSVIASEQRRNSYLDRDLPVRSAVSIVNQLNRDRTPVAFFSAPLAAGLWAKALYPNWYNPKFEQEVSSAGTSDAFAHVLVDEGVEYIVLDDTWSSGKYIKAINAISDEILKVGTVAIRKLNERYKYIEETLPSTNFIAGWALSPGASATNEGLHVNVSSPAYASVPIQPNKKYRYIAEASCVDGIARGRKQVNWLDKRNALLRSDIEVFECKSDTTMYSMDLMAPENATKALVYASGHDQNYIYFKNVSFLK